jgi:TolB-like protein
MRHALIFLLLLLHGCVFHDFPTYWDAADSKFIEANYAAVDRLVESPSEPLDTRMPMVVATLVSVDDLNASSRLGRAISEQLGSRLVSMGIPVTELKLRGTIFVKQSQGELLLSREVQSIARSHEAQAVLVGTYSAARNFVYVNVKIVNVHNNVIIAAHDYVLPLNSEIKALLTANARGAE